MHKPILLMAENLFFLSHFSLLDELPENLVQIDSKFDVILSFV